MPFRTIAFISLIAVMSAVQIGLGIWQWGRMGEKRAFIAAIAAAAAQEPTPFSRAASPLWSRVTLTGRYLHEHNAYIRSSRPTPKPGERDPAGRVPVSGFGVLVMTPFVFRDCGPDGRCALATIYVNRGFLPTPPDGRIPAFDRPDDPVRITGFVRPSEKPGLFQPGNDPARKIWFHRSIEALATSANLFGNADAFDRFIDRQAEPGEAGPLGIEPTAFLKTIPDNHFEYALTWWALAATNVIVMAFFLFGRRRAAQGA